MQTGKVLKVFKLRYMCTVNALYFAFFPMNVISLEFNFVDFAFVTMHCQNVRVVFNFVETVHTRNKSHAKI